MLINATPDMASVKHLLTSADLPTEDLNTDLMVHFFYARIEGETVGVIGAVPCGEDALLRSLVVTAPHRGAGIGSQLVAAAEKHALAMGARRIYLLTLTAEAFFKARGYRVLPRETAPPAVRCTPEFTGLCPVSAALMCKPLASSKEVDP